MRDHSTYRGDFRNASRQKLKEMRRARLDADQPGETQRPTWRGMVEAMRRIRREQ
jgi:hypothetical protein